MKFNIYLNCTVKYFFLILLFSVFHAPCLKAQDSNTHKTPLKKNELKTIIVDSYYPYTYVNEDGVPDGFSIDLAKAVTQVMGLKLRVMVDKWARAKAALENGEIHFLPMMAYSKERDKTFDFSVPHTIAYDAFFTRADSERIKAIKDLPGKKILVMKNDQAHDYLKSNMEIEPENLILIQDLTEALRHLASGEGDVALMPKLIGLIISKDINLRNLTKNPAIIEDYNRPFSFAVKEGDKLLLERLSQGLVIVKNSGQYDEIYKKWFGAIEPKGLSLKSTLKYIAGFFMVLLSIGIALAFWSFSLKKQVALRTKKLKGEIVERKQAENELRKSEERYRTILESIEDGYYEVDIAGNLTFFNDSLCEMLGYSKSKLMGMNNRQYTNEENAKRLYQTFNKVYKTGKPEKGFDWEIIVKDGTIIYTEASVSLRKNLEGQSIGFQGIVRDVSERKRKDEERINLESQLQRAQKMEAIGILAGGIAHDLNNVLSGIVSYPELLLLDMPEDNPLRKPISTIQKSGQKATDIVQDLLTLARRGVVATEVMNLNQIINSYLKSPECKNLKEFHPDVKIESDLETNLLNIVGSPVHLSKTVMNLVSNAAEAMPDGGKVFISTENLYIDRPVKGYDRVAEGDYVTVKVTDTGIGISEEDLKRIFEPFYTKKVMGRSGTGLGMAVVWGTVKDHKGYIDLKSTRGKGTAFTLYFPVTREELPMDESHPLIEDYMGKGESILLIDDVKEQREIASGMLKKLGYSVTSVSSGEEAIEYMKDNSADLLVLDMIMDPGIDGFETYKKILKLHPKQKAVIASGFSETDRVKEAKKLGVGQYIKKPYVLEKIGLAVKDELER